MPDENTAPGRDTLWLVDAHGHFHPQLSTPGRFLLATTANMRAAAPATAAHVLGCVLLAETGAEHLFADLQELAVREAQVLPGWSIRPTRDDHAVLALQGDQPTLIVVAGRQVTTRDGLEVLALGCTAPLTSGRALDDAIREAAAVDALVVIPWGFGKWWFGRGTRVAAALQQRWPTRLFLGDSAGRWRGAPAPELFRYARDHDILVLPGTDPLPLDSRAADAGRYGFIADARLSVDTPWTALHAWLLARSEPLIAWGRRDDFLQVLRHQTAMQLRMRTRRGNAGDAAGSGRSTAAPP